MKISVVIPAYNASSTIKKCLDAVVSQDFKDTYEIVMVDDGSKDNTAEIVKKYKKVKYIFQKNAGPATARNKGWENSNGDIIVFTDSDCVPEKDWLSEMVKPFEKEKSIGAVGGAYGKTINNESKLATLIGEEIKFRYKNIGNYTDAHGSYSLAVRKEILEKVNGFNESYPVATAEDWDLCYKITKLGYKIYFNKKAKTGHHHPSNLKKYLKTQFRHGFYRMKLYKDHKDKASGDKYSGNAKYIVAFSGLTILFLFLGIFINDFLKLFFLCFLILLIFNFKLFEFFLKKDGLLFAIEELLLQLIRGFTWTMGMIKGIISFLIV